MLISEDLLLFRKNHEINVYEASEMNFNGIGFINKNKETTY